MSSFGKILTGLVRIAARSISPFGRNAGVVDTTLIAASFLGTTRCRLMKDCRNKNEAPEEKRSMTHVTKEDIELGLRIIALEELIAQVQPLIKHTEHPSGTWKLHCLRCHIDAVVASSTKGSKK